MHSARTKTSWYARASIVGGEIRGCNVLVKVDSSVRELAERSLLLELGGLLGVLSPQSQLLCSGIPGRSVAATWAAATWAGEF
jgi:hypothetical protein